MKRILTTAALTMLAAPAFADNAATTEQIAAIDGALAAITCEVDPSNIEVEADGSFDLDDVICADGQYDIKLNADYSEAERRKE